MIRLENLTAQYKKGPGGFRLHVDHLQVDPGEILVLIGPNGSGKSSLFRAILNEMPIQEGLVLLDGQDLSKMTARQRAKKLAYVPATQPLGFPLRVRQYVTLGLYPSLGDQMSLGSQDQKTVDEALEKWDLVGLAAQEVDSLSAGERQRASLARAQVQGAALWLLDEPGAHLDAAHQSYLWRNIRQAVKADGITVMVVMHDLNWVAPVADRVALFDQGRIGVLGNWADVGTSENLGKVFGTTIRRVHLDQEKYPIYLPDSDLLNGQSQEKNKKQILKEEEK